MNYSTLQKIISYILLFAFFFGQITGLSIFSFFNQAYATNKDFSNLVSIIVSEEIYEELDDEIERYAKDIQNTLEKTIAVILPIKQETNSFQIASLNESLYNQWYKSLQEVDFESRLIWSIFIWNIPLPIVWKNWETIKSVFPYVDFDDKGFIYDHDTNIFQKNDWNISNPKPEIWHSFISPNTWDTNEDISKIKDFLDKNHDFYEWENQFSSSINVLNGNREEEVPSDYTPSVFYFDWIREQKSIDYSSYKGYDAYMKNIEDISYNRYSKELADKIKDEVLDSQNSQLENIVWAIDSDELKDAFASSSSPDTTNTSDIMTKEIVDGTTNTFIEIFNKWSISDFRTNLHNAWRYNEWTSWVNVDLIPYFISVLDIVSQKVIKSANNDLEEEIDNLVKTSLSRKIAVPTNIHKKDNETWYNRYFENYLHGKKASNINSSYECSIYRGNTANSWQLVEANRGLNINLIDWDINRLNNNCQRLIQSGKSLKWLWWWNTPLNLDNEKISETGVMELKPYNLKWAIEPVFDIIWSKKIENNSLNPSPYNCLDNNLLLQRKYDWADYELKGQRWSCETDNTSGRYNSDLVFEDIYNDSGIWKCEIRHLYLDNNQAKYLSYSDPWKEVEVDYWESWETVKVTVYECKWNNTTSSSTSTNTSWNNWKTNKYYFKSINSYLEHKSPTIDEVNAQLSSFITPNLPIDKDRYIDFISALWNYKKINYPYLFRLSWKNSQEVSQKLDEYLREKSDYINDIIREENPKSLSWSNLEIYELLKVWDYMEEDFDLVNFLKSKPVKNLEIWWETKEVSYYDFLVFSIYWNSLNNISAKYKFVFENYLSDQVSKDTDFDYILSKNKKQYEIAYIGWHWDAENMYIKMDPNGEKDNPYSDIIATNESLNNAKLWIWAINSSNKVDTNFKCAPPDWVPIWEWFPAVQCWLENMLPPQISIWEWNCWSSHILEEMSQEIWETIYSVEDLYSKYMWGGDQCREDDDKNWVNDCLESTLKDDSLLETSSDSLRYLPNKQWNIEAKVLDKDLKRVFIDNSSYIYFDLLKIVDVETDETVYDSSKDSFFYSSDIINQYISFKPISIKSNYWGANYSFSTKWKQADIYFKSRLSLLDHKWEETVSLNSDDLIVKVRNDRLFLSPTLVNQDLEEEFLNYTYANDDTNIYLIDDKNSNLDTNSVNSNSLVFSLSSLWDWWVEKDLNFPIKVTLRDSNSEIIQEESFNKNQLNSIRELYSITKSWEYEIEVVDYYWYKTQNNFTILPLAPSKIQLDLWTNVLESNSAVSNNILSIYDKFDNIVSGDVYDFELSILWDSVVFEANDSKSLTLTTFEWFKAFRLKSSDQAWISKLKIDLIKDSVLISSTSKDIRVIDEVEIGTSYWDELEVWNNRYSVELNIKDKNWNLLNDLNSRVYISSDINYIEFEKDYVEIIEGKAIAYFSTKVKSKKDLEVRFRVEWFDTVFSDYVAIMHAEPMSIELISSGNKLEASPDIQIYVEVELRDIYNNTVFSDNSSKIDLEILDEYKSIISSNSYSQTLKNWITKFRINATELPGAAYLKASIDKTLEDNIHTIWEWDNLVEINWVSQNAIGLETFFFYSGDSVFSNNYNALYTTLVWWAYWDITHENYLAGSMLFDRENRALAVTSLLNSPYNTKNSLSITKNFVSKIYDESDLSQDISITLTKDSSWNHYLDLFNKALNIYIWKIYLNFNNLEVTQDTYDKVVNSDSLNFQEIFWINIDEVIVAPDMPRLNNYLNTKKNSLIIYLETSSYNISSLVENDDSQVKNIYYNDPFSTNDSLNSFSRWRLDTYSNFAKDWNLGWKSSNKTLLSFSSGQNVWESTKQNMDINSINLWDPVVYLKKIKQQSYGITKNFDKTLWKKLNKRPIRFYKTFDYNADSREDILLVEDSWFLSLLENKNIEQSFLDQKNLARVVDFGDLELISTGDFSWDNYDDIFFVNSKWYPFLLDNTKKDFVRVDLTDNFDLLWRITDAKSFDMDWDSITDIVTLDSNWDLNIFYWKSWSLDFEKNTINSWYGISLSWNSTNEMWALYFRWIDDKKEPSSDEVPEVPVNMLERLMFEKLAYDPDIDPTKENHTKQTDFIKSEFASQIWIDVLKTFTDLNWWNLKYKDIVEINVTLKNNTNTQVIRDIVYLEDTMEFFEIDFDSIKKDRDDLIIRPGIWKYKFMVDKFSLNPQEEINITYRVSTKALNFGSIEVGLFEKDEAWDDSFWDVRVSSSNNSCGWEWEIFRSNSQKSYQKWAQTQSCDNSPIPEELARNDVDTNNNWIPDYIDELNDDSDDLILDDSYETNNNALTEYAQEALKDYSDSRKINADDDIFDMIGKINSKVDSVSADLDNLIQWFWCWFGWWNCFASPLNWAPLAPGWDPTLFWFPIWDWLKVNEGIPIISWLTWFNVPGPWWCFQVPMIWPISPFAFRWSCNTSMWAWWMLWANSPTNVFRLYVTPTLTGWVWVAACFGWPASVVWNLPPPWASPAIPGWNCIVAAAPMPNLCKDEEINWNPWSIWQVNYYWWGTYWWSSFWVVNWSCGGWWWNSGWWTSIQSSWHQKLPSSNMINTGLARYYLEYRKNWKVSDNLKDAFKNAFEDPAKPGSYNNYDIQNDNSIISVNWWTWDESDISLSLDFSEDGFSLGSVNEISQSRVAGFPSFITDWVTAQLEEIITKLTDFPTLFVILPDFSSIQGADWWEYFKDLESWQQDAYNSSSPGNTNLVWWDFINNTATSVEKQTSGIKEVYDFLWRVPFVSISWEPININIPWIDKKTLESTKLLWQNSLEWYKEEIEQAVASRTLWLSCDEKTDPQEKEECLEENALSQKILLDANRFVSSVEKNIQVIDSYGEIPQKLARLANKKQDYLEQVLCNIDNIQEITWWWLSRNGKIFRTWVELYILIKAILKSWQLLADIFFDFEAQCHECKNERSDLMTFIMQLISFLIPKIPVIQFPKWPDIVLDLHSIRLNLNIVLPEFDFNQRPIILPPLPELNLPSAPSVNIVIPELEVLPSIDIPTLPDLPNLPTVRLPDLPPAPKLPKLFAELEWVLNIFKLIVKIMCIVKKSPFVPEWRAWDLIAFLTEGGWFRTPDFLDFNLPQFSYPFVDEIQVKTFVNLEFETEFLVEMAKTRIADPINVFTNNFTNALNFKLPDMEPFGSVEWKDANIELWNWGETSLILWELFANYVSKWFNILTKYIDTNSKDTLTSASLLSLINQELVKDSIIKDPRFREFRNTFDTVNRYTYSKEDKIIRDLKQENLEKFEILKSIIKKEIKKTDEMKNDLKEIKKESSYKMISNDNFNHIEAYNSAFDKYSDNFKNRAKSLVNPKYMDSKKLKEDWEYIIRDFKNNAGLIYENDLSASSNTNNYSKRSYRSIKNAKNENNYLASSDTGKYLASLNSSGSSGGSCQAKNSSYQRKYEWIYVIQEEWDTKINYKLFDYLDELSGDETITSIDIDLDSDLDILYSVEEDLYLKENLTESEDWIYYSDVLILDSDSNRFLNGDIFYESPNNVRESVVSDSFLNLGFSALRNNEISNYRLEYYDRIDKYLNEDNPWYIPGDIKLSIVDSFVSSDDNSTIYNTWWIVKRKNLAYVYSVWDNIPWVRLKTKRLQNIKDSISELSIANIPASTRIYAWDNSTEITYLVWDSQVSNNLKIEAHTNIEFDNYIKVIWISWDAYVPALDDITLEWNEINSHLGKPIFFGSEIKINSSFDTSTSSNIWIRYYDDSESRLDFRKIKSYILYDLGLKSDRYSINLDTQNDYFYSRLSWFKQNVFSTKTLWVLLSPQKAADKYAPEIDINSKIKVPVYSQKLVDLTDNVYEDTGISNISSFVIEWIDEDKYEVRKTENSLRVNFGEFEDIFSKKIKFVITDLNWNTNSKDIDFEVYTPIPEISSYSGSEVSWFINESLSWEPINLYRFRWWVIKRLETSSGTTKVDTYSWDFDFSLNNEVSNLVDVSVEDNLAFSINENTWKIIISDPSYSVDVSINEDSFLEFIVSDLSGNPVFSQELKFWETDSNIAVIDDFDDITTSWLYFKFVSDSFDYYKLPDIVEYNPWSLAIYKKTDSLKKPVFSILKDSRISIPNSSDYNINYSSYWDYILLEIADSNSSEVIWELLFRLDTSYVIR